MKEDTSFAANEGLDDISLYKLVISVHDVFVVVTTLSLYPEVVLKTFLLIFHKDK